MWFRTWNKLAIGIEKRSRLAVTNRLHITRLEERVMIKPCPIPNSKFFKNIIGCRFGRLLVIGYAGKNKFRHATWICQCDCGTKKVVSGLALKRGLTRPSPDHSIDRFPDNNGDYEPGNCRWATQTQQGSNRRTNRLIEFDGQRLCVSEWAAKQGIKVVTLASRLRHGWTIEHALTRPVQKHTKRN